ncbi:MAG TPA: DUF3263 domain-containing protein [Acidothermaceae bacterium]|nr:DUF3263 domain-containing protein [Acidothermaceae bacterium]
MRWIVVEIALDLGRERPPSATSSLELVLPQGRDGGTLAGLGELSDLDRALLAIAAEPHPGDGEQERRARAQLGLTATGYHQLLNDLIDRPETLAIGPLLVARLRRLRDR